MDVLDRVRDIGYQVSASGDQIVCRWEAPGKPVPSVVRPLLAELKKHKPEVLATLHAEERRMTFARPHPDGGFVAFRLGVREPVGRGESEFDAVMDL